MELQSTVQLPAGQNAPGSEAGAVCREGQAGGISLIFLKPPKGHRVDLSLPLQWTLRVVTKGPEPRLCVQT